MHLIPLVVVDYGAVDVLVVIIIIRSANRAVGAGGERIVYRETQSDGHLVPDLPDAPLHTEMLIKGHQRFFFPGNYTDPDRKIEQTVPYTELLRGSRRADNTQNNR